MTLRQVAVLFARPDSIYKQMEGCDVYDMERDARTFPGGIPIVGHPPCRAWGQLRHMAKPRPDEKALATWCVDRIREEGGVLEHPAGSTLWPVYGLPEPGQRDKWGGFTIMAPQFWWGHMADKATRFYIVGLEPKELPPIPFTLGEAPRTMSGVTKAKLAKGSRPELLKKDREKTPPALAKWLVELARRTRPPHGPESCCDVSCMVEADAHGEGHSKPAVCALCDGKGFWYCDCHGEILCTHAHGKVTCKACKGTGSAGREGAEG